MNAAILYEELQFEIMTMKQSALADNDKSAFERIKMHQRCANNDSVCIRRITTSQHSMTH